MDKNWPEYPLNITAQRDATYFIDRYAHVPLAERNDEIQRKDMESGTLLTFCQSHINRIPTTTRPARDSGNKIVCFVGPATEGTAKGTAT